MGSENISGRTVVTMRVNFCTEFVKVEGSGFIVTEQYTRVNSRMILRKATASKRTSLVNVLKGLL